jgi:hypothetical protein
MAVPKKDADLLSWGDNFGTRISASPVTYGLSAAQAASFDAKYSAFQVAYTALLAAREAGVRSAPLTATKNSTKFDLTQTARELYGFVQDSLTVTDAQKIELGVVVRDVEPSPVPPPSSDPGIEIVSTVGRTVKIRLVDKTTTGRRGRPLGVIGAAVFSHVGPTAPADISGWTFRGNTGRTEVDVDFPSTVANGATVFLTAFWFNDRKQSGPAAAPISVNLPGGDVSMAA